MHNIPGLANWHLKLDDDAVLTRALTDADLFNGASQRLRGRCPQGEFWYTHCGAPVRSFVVALTGHSLDTPARRSFVVALRQFNSHKSYADKSPEKL